MKRFRARLFKWLGVRREATKRREGADPRRIVRKSDQPLTPEPAPNPIDRSGGCFADLLDAPVSAEAISTLRAAETIGRPLGSPAFLDRLTAATGRDLRPKRRGPKPKVSQMGV